MIGTRTMMSLVPATRVFCGAWTPGAAAAGTGADAAGAAASVSPRATFTATVRQIASRMRGTSGSAAYS